MSLENPENRKTTSPHAGNENLSDDIREQPVHDFDTPLEYAVEQGLVVIPDDPASGFNALPPTPQERGAFDQKKAGMRNEQHAPMSTSKKVTLGLLGGIGVAGTVAASVFFANTGKGDTPSVTPTLNTEPTAEAPVTPGQTITPTEAPTAAISPSPSDIPANSFEATPTPEVDKSAEYAKTLELEVEQTDIQLGADFVSSLESIYNQGLEKAVDMFYSDPSQDYTDIATLVAADSRPMIEALLPSDYKSQPNLVDFANTVEGRNITRIWLYLMTDPELSVGNETRLVTEDHFISLDNATEPSESKKKIVVSAESVPVTIDKTNIRSLPHVYKEVGEGSDWTANVSLEREGEKWVVVNYTSTGTPK